MNKVKLGDVADVKLSKTSGIKNFLFDDFVSFCEIVVPSTDILQKFNKTVSPIFEQIIKSRQENAELARLRDFLLPLLMNGQVRVEKQIV
jgi:type I restriction enzyme S subunit